MWLFLIWASPLLGLHHCRPTDGGRVDLGGADGRSGRQIVDQLQLQGARVDAFDDGEDGFKGHLADDLALAEADFELAGPGQKDEVGGAYAVKRSDEGDGDAAADGVDVLQVLHDLDEAKDGADDADGGRKAGRGFKHFWNAGVFFAGVVQVQLHHFAQVFGVGAVDGELESVFE